ncbi:MAG TPA: hypothetical protein VGA37_09535 [Gemmatimonadales bacterium]
MTASSKRVLMAGKAEVVLALHLVTRHRAARLTALAAAAATGVAAVPGNDQASRALILAAVGTLAAVAASRPLAAGAPFLSARVAVATWRVVFVGRLIGALLPVLVVAGLAVVTRPVFGRALDLALLFATATYGCVLAAVVMGLTPRLGASAATMVGLVCAGVGLLALAPDVAPQSGAGGFAWYVLPLSWRALDALNGGGVADIAFLALWALLGALLVAGALHTKEVP